MAREEKLEPPAIVEEPGARDAAARFGEGYIEDKLILARAMERGRAWAMIAAAANKPTGKPYSDKLNFWLKHCKLEVLVTFSDNDRSAMLKIAENEKDFRKKYFAQPANVRQKWNNYSVLWRNYQKLSDPEAAGKAEGKRQAAAEQRARERELAAIEERELEMAAARKDPDVAALIEQSQDDNRRLRQHLQELHDLLPIRGNPTKTFERLVLGYQRDGASLEEAQSEVAKLLPVMARTLKKVGVPVPAVTATPNNRNGKRRSN